MTTAPDQIVSAIAARAGSAAHARAHAPQTATDVAQVCAAAQRLAQYRRYLAAARAEKIKRGPAGATIDHVVLSQARSARDDARLIAGKTVRLAQQIYVARDIHTSIDAVTATMPALGRVTFEQLLGDALARPGVATKVQALGFAASDVADLQDTYRRAQLSLAIDRGTLVLEQFASDASRRRTAPIANPVRAPARGLHVVHPDRFLALARAFEANPSSVRLDTVKDSGRPMNAVTGMLIGPIALGQLFDAHVRKLEDVGLATYAGSDPASIALLLVAAGIILLIVGFALCSNDNQFDPNNHCDVGKVLQFLGWMTLGLAICVGGGFATIGGTAVECYEALVITAPILAAMVFH